MLINKYQNEANKYQKAKQSGRFPTEMNPRLNLRIANLSYENKSKYYAAERAFKEAISEVMATHFSELITEQQNMIEEIKNEAMIECNSAHLVDIMERNSTKMATAHKYDTTTTSPHERTNHRASWTRGRTRGQRGAPYNHRGRGRGTHP